MYIVETDDVSELPRTIVTLLHSPNHVHDDELTNKSGMVPLITSQ